MIYDSKILIINNIFCINSAPFRYSSSFVLYLTRFVFQHKLVIHYWYSEALRHPMRKLADIVKDAPLCVPYYLKRLSQTPTGVCKLALILWYLGHSYTKFFENLKIWSTTCPKHIGYLQKLSGRQSPQQFHGWASLKPPVCAWYGRFKELCL